jgi:hypothetical protein
MMKRKRGQLGANGIEPVDFMNQSQQGRARTRGERGLADAGAKVSLFSKFNSHRPDLL